MSMELTFNKSGKRYVAEFLATSDFNLHVERDEGGFLYVQQRTSEGGDYDSVRDASFALMDKVVDFDFTALVYPKTIKVVSEVEPTYAVVVSSGEITEIKSQAKSIEITSNGTTRVEPDAGYSYLSGVSVKVNVPQEGGDSASASKWTGHADAEGLKTIGWTDEDIVYYQEHGVNWNAEDDEFHKVSEDNKALYGVLTADNISDYKARIVYLPKIDTSGVTDMQNMFEECYALISIPMLDTSKVTTMSNMFYYCHSLTTIPVLDTTNVTDMSYMFCCCYSLIYIPMLDTRKVTTMYDMFESCCSLVTIPQLDTSMVDSVGYMFGYCTALVTIPSLDTSNATYMDSMLYYCSALVTIPQLDCSNVTSLINFNYCDIIKHAYLKNLKSSCSLSAARLLTKDSLLYMINNEAATSAITIRLHSDAYSRLATDPDITAALAAHPNISLAK